MTANIVTLTMNPALDKSAEVQRVVPENKLRCQRPRFDAGGGGINVARAVTKLGGDATALFLAGGWSGERLTELLKQEGVSSHRIPISSGLSDEEDGNDVLDAMRWLDRLGYHTWRICHYLGPEENSKLPLTDASDYSDD